ncbi:MAG TPA: [protein-PII] uridylyltransferase [Rhizomicrobium sp.]|nr:[protein-PII] uridylyltransferase [Rhizomicrobium sp.]
MGFEKPARFQQLDGVALRRDLTAIARSRADTAERRASALVHIRSVFGETRAGILSRLENGASGIDAARALSDAQDVLLQVLYDFAVKHFYYAQNPTESERLAIVATGGYGRGLLAPFSDVDLLFLRPFKRTAWGESVIEFILLMLWDLGLKVGHAVRTVSESIRLARDDMIIRTALLEARFLWGEAPLARELRNCFEDEVAHGTGNAFVAAKLAERETRHRRQGESRYLVEPNIKEGKGGLRDLQTLYWIGKYLYGVDDPVALADRGVFTREEYTSFRAAEAFLWDVRCRLHHFAGHAEERLSFDVQPELARRMGFVGATGRESVERFMRAYFLTARDVGDLTRIFCAALEEQNTKPLPHVSRLVAGFLAPRKPGDDLFVENGRLNARERVFRRDPRNLIRIFHFADEKNIDVHPRALRTITRSLELITPEFREDREANRLFLAILSSRHAPERALRRMNEAGVLGRFVPQFGHAVALMQFNMYHHYTVDEHLIRAIGFVAAIERGDLKKDHPLSSELITRVGSREALYAAVFLHDIAKGLPGSHSEIGAETAQALCPRWGLSERDTAAVTWLVRNHLLMSDTAQRRDISDPKTLRDFVEKVQSPELLRMLLVLTVADIRAVGPGAWNAWKAQLLRDVYHEAEFVMAGGASGGRPSRAAAARDILAARLAAWPEAEREEALAHHHENYWLSFDDEQLERQAKLRSKAKHSRENFALDARLDELRGICEVTVCTRDHRGLFSQLAGAIAACGGSIVDAKAFTADDGFALDVFSLHDQDGAPFGDATLVTKLRRTMVRAVAGDNFGSPAVFRRVGAQRIAVFRVRPRIDIDNEGSANATVIEVEGRDRPGFLYDIAQALFLEGLSIASARVATYGERAMDVFYVRDTFGQKIVNSERLATIKARLLAAVTAGP